MQPSEEYPFDSVWIISTETELCMWVPPHVFIRADDKSKPVSQALIDDLTARGYERIKGTALYVVASQLNDIITVVYGDDTEYWAASKNIERALAYPVALSFKFPQRADLLTQVARGPYINDGTKMLLIRGMALPPPEWGEYGLILTDENPQTLGLENLSDTARQTRQALQTALSKGYKEEAQIMALQLSEAYFRAHENHNKRLPDIPNPFIGDKMKTLSDQVTQTTLGAISAAQSGGIDWDEENNFPTYSRKVDSGMTSVQIRPPDVPSGPILDISYESLRRLLSTFNDIDGDVLLLMIAEALVQTPDERGMVWISAGKLLDYRGIDPIYKTNENGIKIRHGHRQEALIRAGESIERLASLWVAVALNIYEDKPSGQTKSKKRPPKRAYTRESRLIEISEIIYQHELIGEQNIPTNRYPVAWRFRIGPWHQPFLTGANRQMALITRTALKYEAQFEKRLARYCIFHLRMNSGGGQITRKLQTIFDELHLSINQSDPQKTRDRFEKAMNRLVTDNQIAEWHYSETYGDLPSRGWLPTWLARKIDIIVAPLQLPDASKASTNR